MSHALLPLRDKAFGTHHFDTSFHAFSNYHITTTANMDADHETEIQQREEQPLDTGPAIGDPLPNSIIFWPGPVVTPRENNLPYEMSLIEHGELQRDPSGGVAWNTADLRMPLRWIDGNNKQVISVLTGDPMSWLPDLPFDIPRDVPAWQLVHWYRTTASRGWRLTQQDIFDRMANPLSPGALSTRLQAWQREIGLLPRQSLTPHNWLSKNSMEVVSQLSYEQLRFNTWWHVHVGQDPADASRRTYIAIQPSYHEDYRDSPRPLLGGTLSSAAYYVIKNPEYRQMSEQVKLMDDALLFLTIKADECGIANGFCGITAWIATPAADTWTEDLDVDLVCEFERWREGCSDSPSVDVLRSALEQAGSAAESEAIKNADYSSTRVLQGVVDGLAASREERRVRDEQTKRRIAPKMEKQGSTKRKASDVDEDGTGESKGQATAV
jgi:hypothetical protein